MSRRTWLIVGVVVGLPFMYLLTCPSHGRESSGFGRSQNNLRQIALAVLSYYEYRGKLPRTVLRDKDGRPLSSWRVLLLPYLEYTTIDEQFRKLEPWDSPHNEPLTRETPSIYRSMRNDPPGTTRYQVLVGPGTAFERPELTWADFPDGLANTILVVESATPVPWAKPDDIAYDPSGALPTFGSGYSKPVKLGCHTLRYEPGFFACFADGRTCLVPYIVGEATLRGFITRNGGEPVDASRLD